MEQQPIDERRQNPFTKAIDAIRLKQQQKNQDRQMDLTRLGKFRVRTTPWTDNHAHAYLNKMTKRRTAAKTARKSRKINRVRG